MSNPKQTREEEEVLDLISQANSFIELDQLKQRVLNTRLARISRIRDKYDSYAELQAQIEIIDEHFKEFFDEIEARRQELETTDLDEVVVSSVPEVRNSPPLAIERQERVPSREEMTTSINKPKRLLLPQLQR